jgi:hypothetical protein
LSVILIFAVLLLEYNYNTNNEFSFTITRPHSILLSKMGKKEWFKSHSTLYVSKMMVAAILNFIKFCIWPICWKMSRCYFPVNYGDNQLNGSKVIAFCLFSRWRLRPSCISWRFYIWSSFQKVRHRCYFPVKYGDNWLNGSEVIVLLLFPRWRPPPSWIVSYGHIWAFICIPFVNSNVVSYSMKIGQVGKKLQR